MATEIEKLEAQILRESTPTLAAAIDEAVRLGGTKQEIMARVKRPGGGPMLTGLIDAYVNVAREATK